MNRAVLIEELMKAKIGSKYLKSLVNMYSETSYIPKITRNLLGDEITTDFGVTQGKSSSANIFSFYISDMPKSMNQNISNDYMDPFNLLQLADDSTILADNFRSLGEKTKKVLDYLDRKYLHVNINKTKYIEFSKNPHLLDLVVVDEKRNIYPVKQS